jgi:translation initiation factor SUI1
LVHIRVQQRNGRKHITTVEGLPAYVDEAKLTKLRKIFQTKFACSCVMVSNETLGAIIQLQGDHRHALQSFLMDEKLVPADFIRIHGG